MVWFGVPDMAHAGALTSYYVANRSELIPSLEKLLRLADLGIIDLRVREEGVLGEATQQLSLFDSNAEQQQSMPTRRYLTFEHQGDRLSELFALENESYGTRQLLILGTLLLDGIRGGCTILVDELDASLHPQLVRALVELFYRDNPHNAQLIFNTHDATLLSGELFRRDQVWFVEKDRQGASQLSPLLDFSPRKDESLERGYLRGRYGAVPFIDGDAWQGLAGDAKS